jgi:N-acetylneuraminate lyase
MDLRLTGIVAATHTPFTSDGALNLAAIDRQAEHFLQQHVETVFVGGTTGESHSLSLDERLALAQRWSDACRGTNLKLVVHVGSNCLADTRTLAAQADKLRATAISALSPSYFKPKTLSVLLDCCVEVARAAPSTPFYFYDIPSMTGVQFSMPDFVAQASDRIPTFMPFSGRSERRMGVWMFCGGSTSICLQHWRSVDKVRWAAATTLQHRFIIDSGPRSLRVTW